MHNFKSITVSVALLILALPVHAQTLKGSASSVERQYKTALAYGYGFIETSSSISRYVNAGELLKVQPNRYMELHDVSYPYAREGVKLFLDRLSPQYHNACGEKLVVTSLARPQDRQPANSVSNSVHPAGMAVDLRIPSKSRCRSWLEQTLLSLEAADVLDVTRERNPPHYHVAVFTQSYKSYVASRTQNSHEYVVRPGDSLWVIAARTGTDHTDRKQQPDQRGKLFRRQHHPFRGHSSRASRRHPVAAGKPVRYQRQPDPERQRSERYPVKGWTGTAHQRSCPEAVGRRIRAPLALHFGSIVRGMPSIPRERASTRQLWAILRGP